MDKYTELYAWIWKAFGMEKFSIDQFRSTFPTSQGLKVAHDLVKKGYLKRLGRGAYGAIEPPKFIESVAESGEDLGVLNRAGKFTETLERDGFKLVKELGHFAKIYKGKRMRFEKRVDSLPVSVDLLVDMIRARQTDTGCSFDYLLKNSELRKVIPKR